MEYGLYNWWSKKFRPYSLMDEQFDSLIHPDDLQLAEEINPISKVFIKCGDEGRYIAIEFGCYILRVLPSEWKVIPGDGLKVGDSVKVLSNNGKNTKKIGKVISMIWNSQNRCIVYHLSENGKKLKKQYKIDDFERI